MGNTLYPSARQKFLEGGLNWLSDPIYGILLDTNFYTFSPAHTSLADIVHEAFVKSSGHLTGRTSTMGVADADDLPFPAVSGGPIIKALVLVRDGGTDTGSPLITYIDSAVGLPYTPDGRNIVIQWDNGPNRVFSL